VVFGAKRADVPSPTAPATDYGYTSQRLLDDGMGGLMDYKARFYAPYLNHFIQPDSVIPGLSNPQSLNRYGYVKNNPLRFTDPSGNKPCGDGEKFNCDGSYNPPALGGPKPRPHEGCGNVGQRRCDGEEPTYGNGLVGPPIKSIPESALTLPNPADGYIPFNKVLHPLEGNVVQLIPIYEYSLGHSEQIGYTIVSYAYDSVHFNLWELNPFAPKERSPISTASLGYKLSIMHTSLHKGNS